MNSKSDYFKIHETDVFVLLGSWEKVFLLDKRNNKDIYLGSFDGVVDVGLISENNDWAIAARETIFLWLNGKVLTINRNELSCVESIKLIDKNLLELEVDTLNLNGNKSKWTLNPFTQEIIKSDFT